MLTWALTVRTGSRDVSKRWRALLVFAGLQAVLLRLQHPEGHEVSLTSHDRVFRIEPPEGQGGDADIPANRKLTGCGTRALEPLRNRRRRLATTHFGQREKENRLCVLERYVTSTGRPKTVNSFLGGTKLDGSGLCSRLGQTSTSLK
jgi:hypothetical protein